MNIDRTNVRNTVVDSYEHDTNGNMVTRLEDGVSYTHHWNAFNKLAAVQWQRDGQTCTVQFVYDGDGNSLLKIEGQAGVEVTTYYPGRLFEQQFNTTANQLGAGELATGNCAEASNGVTDYGFTGQRNEASFWLMDFNARYYSPRLGRFIGPDSIVPDPTTGKGFNRYMYADGNPLSYVDPSGHIAVCFQGGTATEHSDDSNGPVDQLCSDLADQGLLGNIIKPYEVFANNADDIKAAQAWLQQMLQENPDEPLIIIGYSWGGGAALDLTERLNDAGRSIDKLVLIDPVQRGRGVMKRANYGENSLGKAVRNVFSLLPANVEEAANFYAGEKDPLILDGLSQIFGALNVEVVDVVDGQTGHFNHHNIMNANNTWGPSSGIIWGQSPSNGQGTLNQTTAGYVANWLRR